jgi:hypothetical protein
MIDLFRPTLTWIRDDFASSPIRFSLEVFAWALSIGCSLVMAATVPDPPLIWIYPFFILGCAIYAWAAWTRRSFGMLANYILLVTIDMVGLARMVAKVIS